METEERPSSTIQPVKEVKKEYNPSNLEDVICDLISKIDPKLLKLFSFYSVRSGNSITKDFLKNFENLVKEKITSPEDAFLVSSIFNTIYQQLSILDQVKLDRSTKEELVTVFAATFYSHIKKIIS